MALLTNFEIPVDSLLSLKFTIINDAVFSKEDRTYNFELDAQVRHCVLVQKTNYRLDVNFINISPSERAYIANYIKINALIPNPKG